jgi:two-component system cell cycle sensor histidine kinase/response regulator CckA
LSTSRFPRWLTLIALAVVVCHVLTIVFFGTSTAGSLIGNGLQIFSSLVAAALCFRASRKTTGFARSFWTLIGFAMAMWGVADLGWSYYEVVLHSEPPPGSMIRFLFDTHGMFFVMAIFLDQEKSSSDIDLEEALDFIQIGILFFFVYFGMYYLPTYTLDSAGALHRETVVMGWMSVGVIALGLVQWRRARLREAQRLYGGLVIYFLFYSLFGTAVELLQVQQETPTGSWFDLAWSLPFLLAAFWAATWEPARGEGERRAAQVSSLPEILINNAMFFFTPLIILFQVAQMGPGWRLVRFSLLAVSLACYAVRIGLNQYHQQRDAETVRRQTLAMDTSVDGIAIINEKGRHVYANTAFARMLGFDGPGQVVGQLWRTVFALQEPDRLEPEVRLFLARNRKWSSRLSLRRPDGSKLPVELTVTAMADGGTLCACRDLTQREQSERARAEAEAKYQMLVEQVNAITYIAEIGIDGQWYYVSPQVEHILGYTPEEWLSLSSNWAQLIHPDDVPAVAAAEKASERGEPFQAEFRIKRKDGREVWLNDTGVVVQGSDQHPVMEGIMVDITERKVLETQLQQSRKMEAVGRLAGGIAHDFNNLLTIITGYTDLALSRPSVPLELRTDIERVENAAGRAAALVRQLLAFSRKQVLQPRTLDLNAIVVNMDSLLRRLIDDNIEMVTHVQDDLGKVKADPAQIEQVIMNLVVNARDAMPNGGRLVLETTNLDLDAAYANEHVSVKPGRYVMLAVSDTGVGMDQHTLAHIFEPFYTTKESGRGTGLGLSTVYGIVKQSGGYIWVYSEPGKGSTFKVYLPRISEQVEESAPPITQLYDQRGTETILLVEDEEAVRDLIVTILSGRGYEVIVARHPAHAEEIASKFPREIHLLLTDVVMPGTSGRELAARIAARRPGIRVLYMSGYTENVITSGGMLEKGLAFLQKPFSPAVLSQKVREVLSHTAAL